MAWVQWHFRGNNMALFNAISPIAGGSLETYFYPSEYPYDLDAGLDFTRPKTGLDYFPAPPRCGMVSGLLPLFNGRVGVAITPEGSITDLLNNPDYVQFAFPDITGGVPKQRG
jgi:hypothetical protein